jgi:predicted phosphodiesterase
MIPDPDLVAFAGDWHATTDWAVKAIRGAAANDCQAIVHAGDFGFKFTSSYLKALRHTLDETDMHLYFVRGNHDDPGQLESWPRDEDGFGIPRHGNTGRERLHYIPQGHRWSWWGLEWMGLGGAHSVDRQWRTPYIDWWPEEWMTIRDMHHAMRYGKVNIMVTHDLPASAKLPNDRKSDTGFFPPEEIVQAENHRIMLQAVVDEVQPDLLVHGHFHERFEQQVGSLHVVGLDRDLSTLRDNLYIVGPDLIERPYRERYPE